MSSRPLTNPYKVINEVSMATSITSEVSVISNISMLSYSYAWSGSTPVGEIVVEVSDDYSINADGSERNAGTWNELPLSETCSVSGNTGTGFIDIDQLGAHAIRTRYVRTSGTGAITAYFKGKVS